MYSSLQRVYNMRPLRYSIRWDSIGRGDRITGITLQGFFLHKNRKKGKTFCKIGQS
jgi:hypothetical protein